MKSRIVNFIFIFLCISTLFICALFSGLKSDEDRSLVENRKLTQYQVPTWDAILDGSWFSYFETYCKDQFFARDISIQSYYRFLDSLNVKERNDRVLGNDSFIMSVKPFCEASDAFETAKTFGEPQVAAMRSIAQVADTYGGTVIYLNIPSKINMFPEKLPKLYNSQEELYYVQNNSILKKAKTAGITVVETYNLLQSHKEEYIYFATDHHWTMRGAYYAYQALLECINKMETEQQLEFPSIDRLNTVINSDRMVGSDLRAWGDSGLIRGDYMEYLLPYDMPEYTRYNNGKISKKVLCDISGSSYSSFMGGNIGNTVIETNRDELPSILYVGFSFTNPLEVMSVYNFDSVASIDPRYWRGSICQYIMETRPDYIVIVRNDIYEGNPQFLCTVE